LHRKLPGAWLGRAGSLIGAALFSIALLIGPSSTPVTPTAHVGAGPSAVRACPRALVPGRLACQALKRTGIRPRLQSTPNSIPGGYGYGPTQLQSAYNLTAASAADGAGTTVALVDAFDDPTALSDLAIYRSAARLPRATISKVNQNGASWPLPARAPVDDDWTLEESLDLDMLSAICPLCNIVLVEATDDTGLNLFTAERTATAVARYVSDSWGGPESREDTVLDQRYLNHPGTVITVSAGDAGYGVSYPASSPYVVAVGGTSLRPASTPRGWTESVWGTLTGGPGTGSGCSAYEPKPSWQSDPGCRRRSDNDIAADADPDTGVAVYDSSNGNGGWNEVGGTSASAPMVAAAYALAGKPGANPAQDIYRHTGSLFPVTTGANGICSPSYMCAAGVGYHAPVGYGSPDGLAAFKADASAVAHHT
jgi:hypothetical protein